MIVTELAGDKFTWNDTQWRWIVVYKKIDFGLDSMISPLPKKYYAQNVSIPIKFEAYNQGVLSLFKVPIQIQIFDPLKNLVYFDSVLPDIDGYASLSLTAPKSFKGFKKGIYSVLITCRGSNDIYPKNDSLKSTFNIGLPYDYQAVKLNVADTMSIGAGGYYIGATIKNNGYFKTALNCPVICEILHKNKQVYYEILNVNLDTGAQTAISYFKKFTPLNAGTYTLVLRTNFLGDMYPKNDTLVKTFFVDIMYIHVITLKKLFNFIEFLL
jgi:hypothetical protein